MGERYREQPEATEIVMDVDGKSLEKGVRACNESHQIAYFYSTGGPIFATSGIAEVFLDFFPEMLDSG